MDEKRTVKMSPEEELVDLLLEFIIVAASLAQKVGRTAKTKQNKEGGTVYGQGMEYVPVKVRKAKLNTNGDIVYIDEERKLPKLIADAISDEQDTSQDEE